MPRRRSNEAQPVRCIALLIAMARAKRGINIRQFADRRGWHWRASYRDVETLRAAGIPIEHEHGWYRLAENWIPAAAVDVKRDELVALRALRGVVAGLRGTQLGQSLDSLCVKLASTSRQVPLPLADEGWLVARSGGAIDYREHGPTIATLRDAIECKHAVQLRYRKPTGEESERIVEPAFLCWEAQLETLYLRAWCRLREAFRTFAVQRIVSVTSLAESFVPRAGAERELADAFRIWCGPALERVVLRFSSAVASEIRERRLHPSQRITDGLDGSLLVELHVSAPEELERWLLGFGPDVQVVAPAALAQRVLERHRSAVERSGMDQQVAPDRVHTSMLRARPRSTVASRTTRRTMHEAAADTVGEQVAAPARPRRQRRSGV